MLIDVPSRFLKDKIEEMRKEKQMLSFNEEKLAAYMVGRWKNGRFTFLDFSIRNQQANRHNHLQDPPLSSTLMVISRSMP